jgi:adenylate kinase family enzyme
VRSRAVTHILSGVLRISVVGNSGSGKTTVAAALAAALGIPHLELDSVFHQPGWVPLPEEEFRRRVAEFVAARRWVTDGNYSSVQDLIWARADTVVWLDPPRYRVMRQVIWRTLRRATLRVELWNGNREPWSNFLRADPEESVIAWAWTKHHKIRQRYECARADPANAHLAFIRLRTPGEVAAFVGRASGQAAGQQPEAAPDAPGSPGSPGPSAE